ncbi:MAG TPA: hypothetical protein VGN12_11845 [Pirellulales bacterium]|jgi:hypothetical protein
MIKHEQEFTPDELRQLDRLVDGELGDQERRQLLATLDTRPDGWRRCALAFLEAQTWEQELGSFAVPPKSVKPKVADVAAPVAESTVTSFESKPTVEASPSLWWKATNVSLPWAMAATFLLAFGLAWTIRSPEARQLVGDSDTGAPVVTKLATADPLPRNTAKKADAATDTGRLDTVKLVMDDGARGQREVELPIESTSADDAWLTQREPIVPRELRQALERMGHRVDERRQFLPVRLDDGRQYVVPVDQVEFTPVSAAVYH